MALLTAALIDIDVVSGDERPLADAVEPALRAVAHLEVLRDGDAIIARTHLGRAERVVLAGHLDTVPLPTTPGTVPSSGPRGRPARAMLYGRGTADMKGGVAVQLALVAGPFDGGAEPDRDVTYIFYDHEEVEADRNGLGRLAANHAAWLAGDFAMLLEPTDGDGRGRLQRHHAGRSDHGRRAAHSARAWMGSNAIHEAGRRPGPARGLRAAEVDVDGLVYREGLNAVTVSGGIAGNVIPDRCVIELNYRFAPDRPPDDAEAHLRDLLRRLRPRPRPTRRRRRRPGLDHPAAAPSSPRSGAAPKPKYGWTDVARFSELGIPAVNFGPGDPLLAHKDDEHVEADAVRECLRVLRSWLTA